MIPPSDDPRDLASEARHGGGFILSQDYYNSRGWRSGLEDDPNAAPQMARILSGRGRYGGYPSYLREWREPSWPIYRAAVLGDLRSRVAKAVTEMPLPWYDLDNPDWTETIEFLVRALG